MTRPQDRYDIVSAFEAQTQSTPERIALVFEADAYTYRDLNAWANRIAHALRARGTARDVPVGLVLDRSAAMIAGLLGILKAGGAYVPLQPDLPASRLAFVLAQAQTPLVLTEERYLGSLSFAGATLCLDRDAALLASQPQENPEPLGGPADLAYIIYTSGSTGSPKGVAVKRENLANYTRAIVGMLDARIQPLTFATVSTLSADLGNTAIFPALVSGGTLCVVDYEAALDGALFAHIAKERRIDVLKITPSNLQALLRYDRPGEVLPRKFLILGGEAASWELVRRVRELSDCIVINHYGPTETTVGCLTYTVLQQDLEDPRSSTVPIGRPIDNVEASIVDEALHPLPVGVPGELLIGGAGVAAGYWRAPDLTAERFIAQPSGAVLYRTGDRVRVLPDGNIEFLGRIDHQVKIRGFRVELGEIEATIASHPAVTQAAVLLREDTPGDQRLTAYFAGTAREEEVRDLLRQRLPDYMLPSALVALASLPLTANGKIDRGALVPPQSIVSGGEQVLARTPVEATLAVIWSEVLRRDAVGVDEDFFALGGHSLMATMVIARARKAFGLKITLRDFFEAPTIAAFAGHIERKQQEARDAELSRMLAELDQLTESEAKALLQGDSDARS